MSDFLLQILETKQQEVLIAQQAMTLPNLRRLAEQRAKSDYRGFQKVIQQKVHAQQNAIIAEIKKASPSKGLLRKDFDPAAIALSYQKTGAACLSVLTDEKYFQGHYQDLQAARTACQLPVLRKDFIVDFYQIYQAATWVADAILLIVAALDKVQLKEFERCAFELGLDVLVEVHTAPELELALELETALLGINNRDLKSFETRIETTLALSSHISEDKIVITESGIQTREHIQIMRDAGVYAFLIGEHFMRADEPGTALSSLI